MELELKQGFGIEDEKTQTTKALLRNRTVSFSSSYATQISVGKFHLDLTQQEKKIIYWKRPWLELKSELRYSMGIKFKTVPILILCIAVRNWIFSDTTFRCKFCSFCQLQYLWLVETDFFMKRDRVGTHVSNVKTVAPTVFRIARFHLDTGQYHSIKEHIAKKLCFGSHFISEYAQKQNSMYIKFNTLIGSVPCYLLQNHRYNNNVLN